MLIIITRVLYMPHDYSIYDKHRNLRDAKQRTSVFVSCRCVNFSPRYSVIKILRIRVNLWINAPVCACAYVWRVCRSADQLIIVAGHFFLPSHTCLTRRWLHLSTSSVLSRDRSARCRIDVIVDIFAQGATGRTEREVEVWDITTAKIPIKCEFLLSHNLIR